MFGKEFVTKSTKNDENKQTASATRSKISARKLACLSIFLRKSEGRSFEEADK